MNAPIHPVAVGICYASGTALMLFGIGGLLSPPTRKSRKTQPEIVFNFFGMPPSKERNELEPAFSVRNLVMGLTILNYTRLGASQRFPLGVAMAGLTCFAVADAYTVAKTAGSKNLQNHVMAAVFFAPVAAYLLGAF